jgi:flagellar motor switch protein FliG
MADLSLRIQEMMNALSKKRGGAGGVNALAKMLGQLDRETEQRILQTLDNQNPQLAKEVRDQYFVFEDLMKMEDGVLQRALGDIHRSTLALALKGTPAELQDKVFRNLSKRAAVLIREDMEMMGPKPRVLVEAAQREAAQELRRWKNVIL